MRAALLALTLAACTPLKSGHDGESQELGCVGGNGSITSIVLLGGLIYVAAPRNIYKISTGGSKPVAIGDFVSGNPAPGDPYSLVSDGSSLFFASGREVFRLELTGGVPVHLGSAPAPIGPMIADSKNLYWAHGTGNNGQIVRFGHLSVDMTAPDSTTLASNQAAPTSLTSDGTNLYWTNADGTVMTVPIDGSRPAAQIANSGASSGIVTDGTRLYWVSISSAMDVIGTDLAGNDPQRVRLHDNACASGTRLSVLAGSTLYATACQLLGQMTTDGHNAKLVFSGLFSLNGLAVDDSSVYVGDELCVKRVAR